MLNAGGNGQNTTYSGQLSVSGGSLGKWGSGILVLANSNNSYAGGTTLYGGELSIAGNAYVSGSATPITFNGGILQVTGNALTSIDSHPVNWLTFNGGFDVASASNTFSTAYSLGGSGSLTKLGAGMLVLGASDSISGPTTIGGGAIQINNNNGLLNSTVAVNANNGLLFGNGVTAPTIGGLSGNGNVTLATVNSVAATLTAGGNGQNTTYTGVLGGSGALVKNGSGMLTLQGNNTYNGTTTVSGGSLVLDSNTPNAGYTYSGGSIAVNNGSTLVLNLAKYVFNGTLFQFDANGGGTIYTEGGGNGGGFVVNSPITFATTGGARDYLSGPLGVNINGQSLNFNVVRGSDPTTDLTVSTVLWNTGSITKTGNGIMAVSVNPTYSGNTTVNGGEITFTSALNWSVSGNININGGDFDLAGGNTRLVNMNSGKAVTFGTSGGTLSLNGVNFYQSSGSMSIANSGGAESFITAAFATGNYGINANGLPVVFNLTRGTAASDVKVMAPIWNNGSLVETGNGILELSGYNSYSGPTTISGGTLLIDGGGALGNGNYTYPITDNSAVIFNSSNNQTLVGSATGSGSLTQNGQSVLTLSNTNGYTGGTTIGGGDLQFGINNALPVSGAITVNGGTLDMNSFLGSAGSVTLVNGTIAATSGGTLTGTNYAVQNGSVFAVLAGAATPLVKTTAGTVSLFGNNSYGGGTTISAGLLRLGNSARWAPAAWSPTAARWTWPPGARP